MSHNANDGKRRSRGKAKTASEILGNGDSSQRKDSQAAPTGMVPSGGPVSPEAPRRPARQPAPSKKAHAYPALDDAQFSLLQGILDTVYEKKVPDDTASDGERFLAEIFEALPDRKIYPDYYQHIPEPVSLDEIQSRLKAREYRTPASFHDDLRLVFLNAMHYNEKGSWIWKDAKTLEKLILEEWEKLVQSGDLPAIDEAQYIRSSDDESKASSQASPDPPVATANGSVPAGNKRRRRGRKASDAASGGDDPSLAAHYDPYSTRPFGFDPQQITGTALALSKKPPETVVSDLARKNGFTGALADNLGLLLLRTSKRNRPQDDLQNLLSEIWTLLGSYEDDSGTFPAAILNGISVKDSEIKSLKEVGAKIKSKDFTSLLQFSYLFTELLAAIREQDEEGTEEYKAATTLHRLYNWITSPFTPLQLPTSADRNLSSSPCGPGRTAIDLCKKEDDENRSKNEDSDLETFISPGETITPADAVQLGRRTTARDREGLDFVLYQGRMYKVGDYVLLHNPDDAAKPIIAQIFRLWSTVLQGKRQIFINVCWYYRPEQTWHTPDTQFYKMEVFKAGIVHDHCLEDIVGQCFVMFYTRYIRGRPKPPVWQPNRTLWICDSRYNEKEKSFNKIKSWNSCIPEELRGQEYDMEMYEKPVGLERVDSPLLTDTENATGRLISPGELARRGLGGDIAKGTSNTSRPSIKSNRKPRRERSVGSVIRVISPDTINEDGTSGIHPVGDIGNAPKAAQEVEILYREATVAHPEALQSSPVDPSETVLPSELQLPAPGSADHGKGQASPPIVASQRVDVTKLGPDTVVPTQTARYFDRDEDGKVLWFSAPPLSQSTMSTLSKDAHSLDYLYLRATDGLHDGDGTFDLLGLDFAPDTDPSLSPSSATSSILDSASSSDNSVSGKRTRDVAMGVGLIDPQQLGPSPAKSPRIAISAQQDAADDDVVVQNNLAIHAGKTFELSLNAFETSESLAEALKELAEVYQGDALSVMPSLGNIGHDDIHEDITTCK